MMQRAIGLCLALGVVAACGGSTEPKVDPPAARTIAIVNYLASPVSLSVDGSPLGSVQAGSSSTVNVGGTAKQLTYSLIPFRYSDGSVIPSDLTGETITLPKSDATLTINNVVNGQPFFTFRAVNTSGVPLNIGIAANGQVRCLGWVASPASASFGYYAFTATTEVRIYRDGTNCTGAYRYWSSDVLSGFAVNSGSITLSATVAP